MSNRLTVVWNEPTATAHLRDIADEYGGVDLVVKLDPKHPRHDGGPEIRGAWFDVPTGHFVCASTACVLPNVAGWLLRPKSTLR